MDLPLNILDLVIVIPLIWGLIQGYRKGLIIELSSLAALILGIWGAIHFSDMVAHWLHENWGWKSDYLPIIALAITFAGIVIGVILLGRILTKMVKMVALGVPNRILGALFSGFKFALIVSVLLFLIAPLNDKFELVPKKTEKESLLYEPISLLGLSLFPYLEELDWRNWFEKQMDDIEDGVLDIIEE
jgi:membrane protein required for colicin V production